MSNIVQEKILGNVTNGPHDVPGLQILTSRDKSINVPNGLVNTRGGGERLEECSPKKQHIEHTKQLSECLFFFVHSWPSDEVFLRCLLRVLLINN